MTAFKAMVVFIIGFATYKKRPDLRQTFLISLPPTRLSRRFLQRRRLYSQGRNDPLQESWLLDFCPRSINNLPANVAIRVDCDPDLLIFHTSPKCREKPPHIQNI